MTSRAETEIRYREWLTELDRHGLLRDGELPAALPALPREPYVEPEYRTSLVSCAARPAPGPQTWLCLGVVLLGLALVLFLAFCALTLGFTPHLGGGR